MSTQLLSVQLFNEAFIIIIIYYYYDYLLLLRPKTAVYGVTRKDTLEKSDQLF